MRDLLDIEEKLTEIRSDIEATQGQLNYMSKQVAYSSLNITFYTKQPEQVATGNGFGYKFKNALTSGMAGSFNRACFIIINLTACYQLDG
jgi:hypothetical protein